MGIVVVTAFAIVVDDAVAPITDSELTIQGIVVVTMHIVAGRIVLEACRG